MTVFGVLLILLGLLLMLTILGFVPGVVLMFLGICSVGVGAMRRR
jgi:hypothetical protein